MPKRSAGLLLFRRTSNGLLVLLVHPGGPFWANKDDGAWSIPKGEFDDAEDGIVAAKREFGEELGEVPEGKPIPLSPVKQAGGKTVHAWALEADFDVANVRSNMFRLEWPPRSGRMQEFPEVDRAAWFDMQAARQRILKGQAPLLDDLMNKVAE